MNTNIKLLVESIFDDNEDIFNPEKEYMDDMSDIIYDNLYKYHPKTKEELAAIIRELCDECKKNKNNTLNLNYIDVSELPENFTDNLFNGLSNMSFNKRVILPDNITKIDISRWSTEYIGYSMFFSNHKLEEVILPRMITTIRCLAFYDCLRLKRIIIPDSVRIIEKSAFADCYQLNDITLPNSVEEFGKDVFQCKGEIKYINTVTVRMVGKDGPWRDVLKNTWNLKFKNIIETTDL